MDDLLEGLNEAQRLAVTTTEGVVRVVAGAGSGKTRALTRRFAYLVSELGIMPGNILCVTFTNKAANEMRQRIHVLTGDEDTAYVSTFHGFCVAVLQEDSHAVGFPKSFFVLDNSDIDSMLSTIYEERGLTLQDMTYAKARDMIEVRKCVTDKDYYKDLIALPLDSLKAKADAATLPAEIIFYGYLYQEKKCFALDYNDLIYLTLHIFRERPEIRLKWQQRLEYIMIDEMQDIDGQQYELMQVLAAHHGNLFVVGDSDQTIYSWRGASHEYMMNLEKDYPDVKTIMMMEDYRSTGSIVAVANSLIAHNRSRIEKALIPMREAGRAVRCHYAPDADKEAGWICDQIACLHDSGAAWRDIAILYRAHYLTRPLEKVLLERKLPYAIYSGVPFYLRSEVKDALSYLRLIVFQDDLSFRRVANRPKRNLGKRRMAWLEEKVKAEGRGLYEVLRENLEDAIFKGTGAGDLVDLVERFSSSWQGRPASEVLSQLLDESGYERMLRTEGSQERLDNLAELKQAVWDYETSCGEEAGLEDYLRHVALYTNSDEPNGGDRIRLMTIHAAKGLEFPHVFVCGLNEGILPSRKVRTIQAMEEERRLAFVALTRAEDSLFLSEAAGMGHEGMVRYPSRFLLEIDQSLMEVENPPSEELVDRAQSRIGLTDSGLLDEDDRTKGFLSIGTRVHHKSFGDGTIVGLDLDKRAHVIQFDGMRTTRTISTRASLALLP